jgi:hypothetical protein
MDDEMGGACSKYEWDEKCIGDVSWKIWREETTWETCSRWKDNIKMEFREIGYEDLAQGMAQWQTRI